MIKRFQTALLVLLAIGFLASCASESSDAKDAAKEAIAVTDATATPVANAQPATQSAVVPTGPTTTISFDETDYDFGTIDEGEIVKHVFKFKNTGNEPLIISNAKGSCGCTVPQWPREPIAVGDNGEITVEFNSKGKKGQRTQKVTITANTNPPQTFINLKGQVTPTAGESKPAIKEAK